MATIDYELVQISENESINEIVFRTPSYFIAIIGGASVVLLIAIIGYRIQRSRYYYDYYDDDDDDERLIPNNGFNCLKKTPTYYQWNRMPPSCQNSSPISPEKKSWEQRRSVLLKKYSAIQQGNDE